MGEGHYLGERRWERGTSWGRGDRRGALAGIEEMGEGH